MVLRQGARNESERLHHVVPAVEVLSYPIRKNHIYFSYPYLDIFY